MNSYILGSVGYAEGFLNGQRVLKSKTLLNNSISFSVNPTEVRGGEGNALIGTLFFDSTFNMSLEDSTFALEYLALKTGSSITTGVTDWASEQITVATANEITVTGTPVDFGGFGKVGFYRVAGSDEEHQITFVGKTASVTGLAEGTKVCVSYNANNANGREIKIASNFVPSELYLLVHTPLFKAGSNSTSESQKVGEVVIEIPRFLIDPSGDLSLTSNGVATVPLSGSAQVSYDTTQSCDDKGFYGRIKEIVTNADILASAKNIVVADSDIDLEVNEEQTLVVYALFDGLTLPTKLDNTDLTFTSGSGTVTSVTSGGVVKGLAEGSSIIDVVVTSHPTLVAKAVVTVTA